MLAFLRTHKMGCVISDQLEINNTKESELSKAVLFRQY